VRIRVAGVDPALANMGIARMILDIETLDLELESLKLTQTEKMTGKTVRQNSDDLRRAIELTGAFQKGVEGCSVVFAEIPSGSQHSRSALGFGVAIGIMAGCPVPLIEVMPSETKIHSAGEKATKSQIIRWAVDKYPSKDWILHARNGKGFAKGDLHDDNEHLADAVAVIHAGIQTPEFKRMLAVWKAIPVAV